MKYVVDYEVWTAAKNIAEDRFDYRSRHDIVADLDPDRLDSIESQRAAADKIFEQVVLQDGAHIYVTGIRPA